MRKFLFMLYLCSVVKLAFAQPDKDLKTTVTNLVSVTINDTIFQFHAVKMANAIKVNKNHYYYWYRNDTILMTVGGYDGRILDGEYKSFYPTKNLYEKGQFSSGEKIGTWTSWYDNGRLRSIITWKNSKRNGPFESYERSGQLIMTGQYKDDKIDGKVRKLNSNGKMEKTDYDSGINETRDKKNTKTDSTIKHVNK